MSEIQKIAEKYISTSELCQRYRRTSRSLARWPETRGFPKPALATQGSESLWLLAEVEAWEEAITTRRA